MDNDLDPVWHSVGGGAAVAAVLALLRLGIEYGFKNRERRLEHDERRRGYQRDAEARLERLLHDRLTDAERRLERWELEVDSERQRRVLIEREHAVLVQAHDSLKEQYTALHAEHAVLLVQHRLLLQRLDTESRPVAALAAADALIEDGANR
jgi:hypothetical protein